MNRRLLLSKARTRLPIHIAVSPSSETATGQRLHSPEIAARPWPLMHPAASAEPALGPYLRAHARAQAAGRPDHGRLRAARHLLARLRTERLATRPPRTCWSPRCRRTTRPSGGSSSCATPATPRAPCRPPSSVVESPEAARRTAQDARRRTGPTQRVMDSVTVEPEGESNILAVTGTADDAELGRHGWRTPSRSRRWRFAATRSTATSARCSISSRASEGARIDGHRGSGAARGPHQPARERAHRQRPDALDLQAAEVPTSPRAPARW